jgi:mannose-1-phosphate guanylyltransferase/phosphomannomutase
MSTSSDIEASTRRTDPGVEVAPGGGWALVLPDPSEALTHVWAEGRDPAQATDLLTRWAEVVEATSP